MKVKIGPYASNWNIVDATPLVGAFTKVCKDNYIIDSNWFSFLTDMGIVGYYHTYGFRQVDDLIRAGINYLF